MTASASARLVIDSGVVVKWYVPEEHWDRARALRDRARNHRVHLLAPDLLYAEVGNVVWKKHRYQGLDIADARLIVAAVAALPLDVRPNSELLADAYDLAVAHGRTVYDCLYLALSLRERCPFVTADERLAHAVASAVPGVIRLADWR